MTPRRLSVAAGQIHTYDQLQRQIHHDLRVQHPEWVEPNGDSPMCDLYDRRLAGLIMVFQSIDPNSMQHNTPCGLYV